MPYYELNLPCEWVKEFPTIVTCTHCPFIYAGSGIYEVVGGTFLRPIGGDAIAVAQKHHDQSRGASYLGISPENEKLTLEGEHFLFRFAIQGMPVESPVK